MEYYPADTAPIDPEIQLRGNGVTLQLYRVSTIRYEYRRPFDDRAALERAFPDGTYTVVSSKGSKTITVSTSAAITEARVSNFETLQRWNGSATISAAVEIATPALGATAELRVLPSGSPLLGMGAVPVTTPTTMLTMPITVAMPPMSPGQALNAEVVLQSGGYVTDPTGTSTSIYRYHTLKFPVTRAHLPPQITTQPVAETVTAGAKVTLTVAASGNGLSYLWLKDSLPILGATNATLTIAVAQPSDAGLYTAAVTNTGGVAVSMPVRVIVNAATTAPSILNQPVGVTAHAGAAHTLMAAVSGTGPLMYQWFRDGVAVTGGTAATLDLNILKPSDAGAYTVTVSNALGSVNSNQAIVTVIPVNRISNLSIRTQLTPANPTLTVGLTVGGGEANTTKPLLVRAVGPTLAAFGVDGVLADARLALQAGEIIIAENDDWAGAPAISDVAAAVGAFALTNAASRDAALVPRVAGGGYTVRATGGGAGTGVVLVEVYDANESTAFTTRTPRLTNVSALAQVGTGGGILIAGFSISGSGTQRILVRGIGPALATFGVGGVLMDSRLEVFTNGTNEPVAVNDNWGTDDATEIARAGVSVGAFALDPAAKDAALVLSLPPGSYTAQVSGVGGVTGVGLVEIYELPAQSGGR